MECMLQPCSPLPQKGLSPHLCSLNTLIVFFLHQGWVKPDNVDGSYPWGTDRLREDTDLRMSGKRQRNGMVIAQEKK